jgi:SAM-dependent methyltransferase
MEHPRVQGEEAMESLEQRRHAHPWWGAPARLLNMFSFDPFAELLSPRWEGREAEWTRLTMQLNVLLSYVFGKGVSRVLDVAAGSGFVAAHLAWSSTQVRLEKWRVTAGVASEGEEAEIRAAVRRLRATRYLEAVDMLDPRDLSRYADESFDVVYAFGPLYQLHDDDRHRVIAEMARVLAPRGRAIATFKLRRGAVARAVSNPSTWENLDDLMHLALFDNPKRYAPIENPPQLGAYTYTDLEEIRHLFGSAGLKEIERIPVDVLVGWLPPSGWNKIKELGREAFNTLLTMDDTLAFDPSMHGMSSEILVVGGKTTGDTSS